MKRPMHGRGRLEAAGLTAAEHFSVRLFFAALPDAATRARIAAVADSLRLARESRRVPPANYHVTLAFVGEIPASQMQQVLEVGRAQRAAQFSLAFDAYEYWPTAQAVVAAARAVPPALDHLSRQLRRELAAHHLTLDPKSFRPHVTLARKVLQAPVLPAMYSFEWLVSEFCLMRSKMCGARSAYTVVDTWSLLYDAAET